MNAMNKIIDAYTPSTSTGSVLGNPYPLAVVGFACYLPDASSPEEYWRNLKDGRVSIKKMESARFPGVFYAPDPEREKKAKKGRSYTNLAALIDYDHFCNVEVPRMREEFARRGVGNDALPKTPGHLLALKVAFEALRSTGSDPFKLPSSSIGVFCGFTYDNSPRQFAPVHPNAASLADVLCSLPSFQALSSELRASTLNAFLSEYPVGCAMACEEFIAEEKPHELVRSIQAAFGLSGAGFKFDAVCSSSLLAFDLARNYLQSGVLDAALVGGFNMVTPIDLVIFTNASSCSAQGVFPFDERADGLVPGEGCVFAVVKSLEKAVASGDRILGVVRGIGFSSDGRGKSLWAPSADGQELAIERAFSDAGCKSWSEIDRIEAHATSTQLGDATELQALSGAMASSGLPIESIIPITSVKANIGHMLEAAGAASVLKTILELSHEEKIKQTSFSTPSSKVDWESSPMRVLVENEPWTTRAGRVRKSCVQAFGIGGLNACAVLEGPEGAADATEQSEGISDEQIAIIGVGCVLPCAFDASSFKKLVEEGKSAIVPIPRDRAGTLFTDADRADLQSLYYKARGGFVQGFEYDWKRHFIPPKQIKDADPLQFMTLDAADQAILSSGYRSRHAKIDLQDTSRVALKVLDSRSTAAIVGTSTEGDYFNAFSLALLTPIYQDRLEKALELNGVSNVTSRAIGEDFFETVYEKDYSWVKDETVSSAASTLASRITKTYDLMGGGCAIDSGGITTFTTLKNAALLLRRRHELRTIVCVVGDRCMNRDDFVGYAKRHVIPGEGAVAFLLKRVEDAQKDGDPILAVISHVDEERLVKNDASSAFERLRQFAASSADLANVERPLFIETICATDDVERRVNAEMKKFAEPNAAVVFGETKVSARQLIGDLGAASGAVAILHAILNMQDRTDNPRAVVSQWDCDGMVAQITLDKAPVERAAKPVKARTSVQETAAVIRTASASRNDRVVFLFPGQGSQYARMLTPIIRALPEAREVRDELDSELKSLGYPTFTEFASDADGALGVDVTATQLSLLAADTLVDRTMRRLGIEPDIVAGHSYGEYPTLVAAGVLTFADAARATCERCRIIDETIKAAGAPSGMLSTNAPKDVIERIFDRLRPQFGGGAFFISNRNAPDNTILSATRPALERIAEELKAEHFGSVTLTVPAGYHSPLVGGVRPGLAKALRDVPFDFAKTPFLSGVSMRFESDPEVMRDNLIEQMTKPVDFIEMMERAYRNGGRRFVEIGPKQVLTRLAAKILKEKSDVSFFATDFGVKGVEREFDLASLDPLRRTSVQVAIPNATTGADVVKTSCEETTPKNDDAAPTNCVVLSGESLPEDVVSYSGTPYEIGLARGRYDGDRIRRALRRYADVAGTPTEKLLPTFDESELASAQDVFGADGYEELRGLAEGAGVSLAALIRHNLSVFPVSREHVAEWGGVAKPTGGCSHFAGATSDGDFVHGGNIDAPFSNIIPNALASRIVARRPSSGYASVSISLTGLIGSRGGVNERGLAATTCDLLDDVYKNAPKTGLRRGVVLQTILDRCATVEEALDFLKSARLSGAKSIGLSDAQGKTALVEYVGGERNALVVKRWFGSNHAQALRSALDHPSAPAHSIARYERMRELLGESVEGLKLARANAFSVLRDENDPKRATTGASARFRSLSMILRADNAFSWLLYRNAGVIQFKRSYSSALEPENDKQGFVFPIKEILPEYRSEARNWRQKDAEAEKSDDCRTEVKERFNPLMKSNDYLANLEADYAVSRDENSSTVRYEDRIIQVPARASATTAPQGGVLIVAASENELARELERKISSLGGDVNLIALLDRNGAPKSIATVQEEIATQTQSAFPKNFLILTSYDESERVFDSKDAWTQVRERGVKYPIFALQAWYRIALERKIDLTTLTVVAATRMGGMLGADGRTTQPNDGAMMGLMRSLQYETFIEKKARVYSFCVDHEYDADIKTVAQNLITEIQRDPEFAEDVGFRDGKRYVMRLNVQVQEPTTRRQEPTPGEAPVWVVTGGRRGVTAELAYGLGTNLGAKLCLVGSSDPDIPLVEEALELDAAGLKELKKKVVRQALEENKKPADAWARFERALETRRTLKRFQDAKIEVASYNCDLSNFEEARALTLRILAEQGRIDGILFGAGFEKAALFEKSVEETVLKIIDVKVASAIAMLSAFDESNYPKRIMGMGSISGRLGALGQVGYSVANNMLAKTLAAFANRYPDCRSTVIHWPAWGEVGMAVRPESKFMLESLGIKFMPVKEGVKLFVDEVDGARQPCEICKNDPENNHLYSTAIFPYFSEKALAPIRANVADARREDADETRDVEAKRPDDVKIFVDGESWEARALRAEAGETAMEDANIYVVTQPREYGAVKARGDARVAARDANRDAVLARVAQWRRARRTREGDALVILGIADVDSTSERDEGYDYFTRASEMADVEPDDQFEIVLVETKLDEIPTLDLLNETVCESWDEQQTACDVPEAETRALVRRVSADAERIVSEASLDPNVAPYLLDHQLKGTPILPIAMALEFFAETIIDEFDKEHFWEFQSIKAINGFLFTQPRPYDAQTIATLDADRFWSLKLVGDRYNANGKKVSAAFPYFTGKARRLATTDGEGFLPEATSFELDNAYEWVTTYRQRNLNGLYHGPRLQALKRCFFMNETEMIGEVVASSREELLGVEAKNATLDVALFDALFWACGAINGHYHRRFLGKGTAPAIIPDSIASLRGFSGRVTPGSTCLVHAVVRDRVTLPMGYTQVVFDFVLYNENGSPVWHATGFKATEI